MRCYPERRCAGDALVPLLVWMVLFGLMGPGASRCEAQGSAGEPHPAAGAEVVAGRVVDATDGRAIGHADVMLEDNKTSKLTAETLAAENGEFHLAAVPPGRYHLVGRARGYLEADYLQHGLLSAAVVTGAGLPTGELVLRLEPSAQIRGRVTDEAQEPVLHATVALYCEAKDSPEERMVRLHTEQTGEDGRFLFRNLGAGRYFLVATALPWYAVHPPAQEEATAVPYRAAVDAALDVAYPPVYYPGVLQADQAVALTLKAGDTVPADLQMVPVPAVTLRLQRAPSSGGMQYFPTVERSIFGVREAVPMQGVSINGVQELTGLAPGDYTLQVYDPATRSVTGEQTIDAVGGTTTVDLAHQARGTELAVQVQAAPGRTLPPDLQIDLRDLRRRRRVASSTVDAKGVAHFPHVPPGQYRPVLFHAGREMGIARLDVGGQPAPGREIRLEDEGDAGAETLPVILVTSGEPVTVQGVVERGGKPVPGVLVILVPAGPDTSADLFRRDETDLDGGFTLPQVQPGDYIAVAVEEGWDLAWTDVKAVSRYLLHGVPVTVAPGMNSPLRLREALLPQARRGFGEAQ